MCRWLVVDRLLFAILQVSVRALAVYHLHACNLTETIVAFNPLFQLLLPKCALHFVVDEVLRWIAKKRKGDAREDGNHIRHRLRSMHRREVLSELRGLVFMRPLG